MNADKREGISSWLSPGIKISNAATLFFCAWVSTMMMTYFAFLRPMLFVEVMGIPSDQHGTLTAILMVVNDPVVWAVSLYVGATSDRVGRRVFFVLGMLIAAASVAFLPFARGVPDLIALSVIGGAGFGAMTVTISAMGQDYPREHVRGKFLGIKSVVAGCGVLFMALVLTRIPKWVNEAGYSQATAVSVAIWAGAVLILMAAIVGYIGLSPKPASVKEKKSTFAGLKEALLAARSNRKIRFAYAVGYVGRGDLAIFSIFFSLWFMSVGLEAGKESSDIVAFSGTMFGVATIAGLIAGPTFGLVADRIKRETAVMISLALAAVAYFAMALIDDPFVLAAIIPACIILGAAEIGVIVTGASLVGQEAPEETRGAVVSCFQVVGGMGITSCVFVGGILFDRVSPNAPFMMMAVLNVLAVLFGIYTLRKPKTETSPSYSEAGGG